MLSGGDGEAGQDMAAAEKALRPPLLPICTCVAGAGLGENVQKSLRW